MNKREKTYSIISVVVLFLVVIFGGILTWLFFDQFSGNPELLRSYLNSFDRVNSVLVFIGIQILQIIFPIIPGEIVEFGAGYVFGPWLGFLLCEIGIIVSSYPIFLLSKKYGMKFVSMVFDESKINYWSFLKNKRRLTAIVFLIFFIPGTPKDLLTYFAGLTPIRGLSFLFITVIARIPTILSSTMAGASFGNNNILLTVLIYVVTGVFSIIAYYLYKHYEKTRQPNN